jgi:hypothetical protein
MGEIAGNGHSGVIAGAGAEVFLVGDHCCDNHLTLALAFPGKADEPVEVHVIGLAADGAGLAADGKARQDRGSAATISFAISGKN